MSQLLSKERICPQSWSSIPVVVAVAVADVAAFVKAAAAFLVAAAAAVVEAEELLLLLHIQ